MTNCGDQDLSKYFSFLKTNIEQIASKRHPSNTAQMNFSPLKNQKWNIDKPFFSNKRLRSVYKKFRSIYFLF
jgi:hypothetical protein